MTRTRIQKPKKVRSRATEVPHAPVERHQGSRTSKLIEEVEDLLGQMDVLLRARGG